MEYGVKCLDARNGDFGILCQLDRRAEIRLDFHWSPGNIVLPHDALGHIRLRHFVNSLLLEFRTKFAAIRFS
jgi:hypothetical protein